VSDNELLIQIAADIHALTWMAAIGLGIVFMVGWLSFLAVKQAIERTMREENEKAED
jgi:hypothetical protein